MVSIDTFNVTQMCMKQIKDVGSYSDLKTNYLRKARDVILLYGLFLKLDGLLLINLSTSAYEEYSCSLVYI